MTSSLKQAFSGFFSQLVVVCLLGLFIVISLVAMFTTGGVPKEMDWIGMTVRALGADGAAARGIPGDAGVVIEEVDGLAARAGIQSGDVLLAINGSRVQDMADFAHVTGKTDLSRGGVQLDVVRRGARMPVFVFPPVSKGQAPAQTAPRAIAPAPGLINRQWLGIDAETLAAGDTRELGIPATVEGVLIDGVARGSHAERAGLSANDIIVSVNGQRIGSTAGLWNTLAGLDGDGRVEFGVYRNGQLTSVVLPTASGMLAGGFPGQMGGQGWGPGGVLACPNCKTRVTRARGVPCYSVPCPSCGTWMIRVQ